MTRTMRSAPLVVALFLLTSAATASAECAWVLWAASLSSGKSTWRPETAFETLARCQAGRQWQHERATQAVFK